MKKLFIALAVMMLCASWSLAATARITEDVDANLWSFGATPPELVASGNRGDGTGAYHHLPIGTSPYYRSVIAAGEGSVTFWIYDPYVCTQDPPPAGVAAHGPMWGLSTPGSQCVTVGMWRRSDIGCTAYKEWSSVAASDPWWFCDGTRGSSNVPFQAGWYKWSVAGTYTDVTFTVYNIAYIAQSVQITGDCTQTYDATSFTNDWASLFGFGWQAFYINGDAASGGLEAIDANVVSGTGVFDEYTVGIAKPFHQTTWGNIKALYR